LKKSSHQVVTFHETIAIFVVWMMKKNEVLKIEKSGLFPNQNTDQSR
tara:strand:- start:1437 stop:1577 length:141 start_codon:yes stop_codon:yes gene_type:complete